MRSTSASHSIEGQATKCLTVKSSIEPPVVYHSQKVSEKSSWKVIPVKKNSESNSISEKTVLFFQSKCFKEKNYVPFLQSHP